MNWLYPFSTTELCFVGLFLLFYIYYFFRTFRLARQLNTSAQAVIPKFFLRSVYLALLLAALLGPSFGEADREVATQGRDVYLLLDVSRSMDATDIVPSRLERVKYDITQLTDSLAADRFGLILFATDAFVLSPLTADHEALNQFIRSIRTEAAPSGGTNLCSALELARQKLMTDLSTRQSAKSIVLFSDGEDFGICDRSVLGRLRIFGIPLITVGIGTEIGGPIREGNELLRDNQQQIVRTRLNRAYLRNLARDGGGQYVETNVTGSYVTDLASVLRSLPGRTIDQRRVAIATNKYYYFLLAALGLIVVDLLITVRTLRL